MHWLPEMAFSWPGDIGSFHFHQSLLFIISNCVKIWSFFHLVIILLDWPACFPCLVLHQDIEVFIVAEITHFLCTINPVKQWRENGGWSAIHHSRLTGIYQHSHKFDLPFSNRRLTALTPHAHSQPTNARPGWCPGLWRQRCSMTSYLPWEKDFYF